MAENLGIAPPDMTSDTGKLRAILGDLVFEPTATPNVGDYVLFSDTELNVFLTVSGGLSGAAALAYMQLAASAAMESKSVKDYDLQVDLTKRAKDFLDLAQMWRDRERDSNADLFELFPVEWAGQINYSPEGTPFDWSQYGL